VTRFVVILGMLLAVALPARPQAEAQAPPEAPARGQREVAPTPQPSAGPSIEPLGEDRYRICDLVLDRKAGEVRVSGAIAVREGPLEYLICAPEGKLYESLLRADVDPYHLHLALLLIGLQPKNNLEFQGDPATPEGDPLGIFVSWKAGDERVTHRADELLWEPYNEKAMTRTDWVFTGSMFADGAFAASINKSIVAVYNDPVAIINNPLATGADDTSYSAHTAALPEVGTEVEIVFRVAASPGEGS